MFAGAANDQIETRRSGKNRVRSMKQTWSSDGSGPYDVDEF
jgi:hypothetical protein